MTTPLSRIDVGKCYRDRFGAVFRVTASDGAIVEFVAYMKGEDGSETCFSGSEAFLLFTRDLQEEVPCPGALPHCVDATPPAS